MSAQLAFDLPCRPAYGKEDFLVSENTEEAVAFLDRWPDWPDFAVVLLGPKGGGKTHLAHVWQEKAEAVFFETGQALHNKNIIVDDADRLAKTHTTELLHLYNRVKEQGNFLLLTTARLPRLWDITLPDLESRILATPLVHIEDADDALLQCLLVKLFQDHQLSIDDSIIHFILPRMTRSFEAARLLVQEIDQFALAQKRKVTIPLVREVLSQKND